MASLPFPILILMILIYSSSCLNQVTYEVLLEDVQVSKSSDSVDFMNFKSYRVRKLNRTVSALSMDFEIPNDFDALSTMEVDLYYRRTSGNQYEKTPTHIPEMTFPEYSKKYYVPIVMKSLKTCSNLPQYEPDEKDYKLPKGAYSLKDCVFSTDSFPPYLAIGFYKAVVKISRDSESVFIEIIARTEPIAGFAG